MVKLKGAQVRGQGKRAGKQKRVIEGYLAPHEMKRPLVSDGPHQTLLKEVDTAVRVLRDGGVVSVPTDTLYGLAASALNEQAVERLFRIKGRRRSTPLPLLLADSAEIEVYAVDIPTAAWRLAESFFPGPLTLVLPGAGNLPDVVSGGLETIALRVPDHWVPRAIIRKLGVPITGTSANRTGMPGLTTAGAVRQLLGSDIDYVVDGGQCAGGVASTVLDVSGASPRILRQGAVSRRELEEVCGESVAVDES